MHTTWPNRPYFRPSDPRGSHCLSWRRRQSTFDALKVGVTKVDGERDEIKGLVKMMTRERTVIHGRRENLLREG